MLVSKKINKSPYQLSFIDEKIIEVALSNTRRKVVEILDRFQKVSAELTAPDIQNIFIPLFFTELPDYYIFEESLKKETIAKLQNMFSNIDKLAGDFEVTKKRNGWWSDLYRQKWESK